MEKFLQLLLKEVNTVILPGLGALTVTNHSTGEIMFMPYLKYDDGKLSAFIAAQANCSEEEAKNMISAHVHTIQTTIENGGVFSIKGLGSFSKDNSGDIQFSDTVVETSTPVEHVETIAPVIEVKEAENAVAPEKEPEVILPSTTLTTEDEAILPVVPVPVSEPVKPVKKGFFGMFKKQAPVVEIKTADEEVKADTVEDSLPEEIIETTVSVQDETSVNEVADTLAEEILIVNEEPVIEVFETPFTANEIVDEPAVLPEIEEKVIDPVLEEKPVEVQPVVETTDDEINFSAEETETDETVQPVKPVKTKKKKGVGFWILISSLILVAGGGTYVGLKYDELKQYLPFTSDNSTKTIDISEEDIIEKLESDKTTPSESETSASEEMIEDQTPEETSVPEEIAVSEPVESSPKPKVKKHKSNSNSNSGASASSGAPASVGGEYHIVLASFTEKTNAESYVARMISLGKTSATIVERDGKFVACFGSYASKSDAISNLTSAKEISTNAWVLHKP